MEYQTVQKITLSKQERVKLDYIWRLANRCKLPDTYLYGRTYGDTLQKKLIVLRKNCKELDSRIQDLIK